METLVWVIILKKCVQILFIKGFVIAYNKNQIIVKVIVSEEIEI